MDMKENGKKEMLRQKAFIRRVVIISGIVIATIITAQSVGYSQDKKMTMKEKEDAWRAERLKKRAKEERLEFVNDSVQYAQAIVAIRKPKD